MELGLNGRAAAIAGASGELGQAIACGLAAEGVDVALLGCDKEQLEQAAEQIRQQYGVRALALPADMGDASQVAAAAARQLGMLHILVNNADSQGRQGGWSDKERPNADSRRASATLRAVSAFSRHIARDGSGRIITIEQAPGASAVPAPTEELCSAAVNQTTGYLAHSLASAKITVNTVVAGQIAAGWPAGWAAARAQRLGSSYAEFMAPLCRQRGIPAGRLAEMGEISDVVVFLASDRARYINGTRIVVDGGLSASAC